MFSSSSSSRSCVAFRFVLFVVLICFRFGFLQFFLPHPPRPLCKYSSSSSGSIGSLPALPAFHLYLSHSRSHFLSLLRAFSVTAKSKQRKQRHTSSVAINVAVAVGVAAAKRAKLFCFPLGRFK